MLFDDGELMSQAHHTEEGITFVVAPVFDNLILWHTPQHRKIAPSPAGIKRGGKYVYIVIYDYHPSKFRQGPFVSEYFKLFVEQKKNGRGKSRNEKRDETV